jgi:hypothetical protein
VYQIGHSYWEYIPVYKVLFSVSDLHSLYADIGLAALLKNADPYLIPVPVAVVIHADTTN